MSLKQDEVKVWVCARRVYGYFNNHFHGYAAENCLSLIERLLTLTPQQVEAKKRISKKQVGLTDFFKKQ